MNEDKKQFNGELAAQYFKFFLQQKNPYVIYKNPVHRVSVKGFYSKHKETFDKLVKVFNKYNIDIENYLHFFVIIQNKFEKDIETHLINQFMIQLYIEYLSIKEKRSYIYRMFVKSAKCIAKECIQLKYNSVIDYFRYLIKNRLLANYYISGKISQYYFAAIPKFNNLIDKLDQLSKDEFKCLYDRYDTYNADVNDAFMQMKNIRLNPIKFTNDLIVKYKNLI